MTKLLSYAAVLVLTAAPVLSKDDTTYNIEKGASGCTVVASKIVGNGIDSTEKVVASRIVGNGFTSEDEATAAMRANPECK